MKTALKLARAQAASASQRRDLETDLEQFLHKGCERVLRATQFAGKERDVVVAQAQLRRVVPRSGTSLALKLR